MRMRLLIGCVAALMTCVGVDSQAQWAVPRAEVIFPDNTRVMVEIADTPATRQRGLMFREHLAPNEGMIFVFEERGVYPFWMKNTLIPLDMFWVDEDGQVVALAQSVPPCKADPCPSYSPGVEAVYVVETVAGFAKKHGVQVGDELTLKGVPEPGARRQE